MAVSEPFPPFNSSLDAYPTSTDANGSTARRRRKSSLNGEARGDTGAPAMATSLAHINAAHGQQYTMHLDSKDGSAKRSSKRRSARTVARRVKNYVTKHTWVLPAVILAVFLSLYMLNPTESNPIHKFIFLSYRLPIPAGSPPDTPAQYAKGPWDIALVTFYTVVLSFTREFVMQELLRPLARYCGLKSRGKQARFMEQMYTALYFGILGPAGMYVMSRTPVWYFNTRGMYEGFPHKTHEGMFKFYYLFQAAYWTQQAIVLLLGMEKPRKDFRELVGHHIVSISLIGLSYRFHFTYMGLAVYITHDISDFFLATSKSLNYLDHFIVGPYFFLFMNVWIYMRHYLNLKIIWSLFHEFKTVGPYELNWETQQYKCSLSNVISLALLGSLQALNLFWLFFIVRIAYRFVTTHTADDDRSDNEDTEDEAEPVEKIAEKEKKAPVASLTNGINGHANGTVTKGFSKESNGHANGHAVKR